MPKFKVGDIIQSKHRNVWDNATWTILAVSETEYRWQYNLGSAAGWSFFDDLESSCEICQSKLDKYVKDKLLTMGIKL